MKKLRLLIIALTLTLMTIGCAHKAIDGVSYVKSHNGTTFITITPTGTEQSNLILILNTADKTRAGGIYDVNTFGSRNSLMGKWEMINDTLVLYPEMYVGLGKEDDKFHYEMIDKNNRCVNELVQSYKVRNDTLFEITDYTEFYKKSAEKYGIGAKYKYNPNEMYPFYKLIPYKHVKIKRLHYL